MSSCISKMSWTIRFQQEAQPAYVYLSRSRNRNQKLYECWQTLLSGPSLLILIPRMLIQQIQQIGAVAGDN